MLKRLFAAASLFIASFSFIAGQAAWAQGAAPAEALYTELSKPLPVDSADKIEVVEFFWYGCPHCYALEPSMQTWLSKLPKDVEFKRIPAPPNEVWKIAARAYYALDALGLQPKIHKALFDAVQMDHLRLTSPQQFDDWLSRQNVDVARYHAAENSFSVESRLKRAEQLFNQSQATGVPTIVVNGRYMIEMSKAGTPEKVIETMNTLIEQVRKGKEVAAKK